MRRILAAVAVLATTLAASACDSNDKGKQAAAGNTKVDVGVIAIIDVAPIYLGKTKGFFAKRGINLTLTAEQGGAPITKGVIAGKYQFGFSNVTSLMSAELDGAPLKGVASGVASTGRHGRDFSAIVVNDGSPIRTAKDLVGKTISVNTLKNIGDTTVRQSVRAAGGDPRGVKFVAMPFPEAPGALQSGKVDASWVVEPQLSQILTQGGQVIASNFVDAAPDLTISLWFTNKDLIAKNPALVKNFTEAINESMQYADAHPEEVRDTVGTYTTINDTVRIAMILPKWPLQVNRASIQKVAQLGQEDGIFKSAPAIDQLLP
jgi:NitT/TauT family transport system substrate-binding protein